MNKPPLVIFSPLPPVRNGIADYAKVLIQQLDRYYDCIAVIANEAPEPDPLCARILFEAEYAAIRQELASLRHLYLIGNNATHRYVLNHLQVVPGIVNLHDLTLNHLVRTSLPVGNHSELLARIVEIAYGDAGGHLLGYGLPSAIAAEMPMVELLTPHALAVITLSQFARCRIAGNGLDCPVVAIPDPSLAPGASARGRAAPSGAAREQPAPVRLACLGFMTRAKGIDLVLQAVGHLRSAGTDVTLTVAGERMPDEYNVDRDIDRLGLGGVCRVIDYLSEPELLAEIEQADIVLNLRLPTFGETSGILTRAMAAGKCAVVTDHGSYSGLPDDAVVKVGLREMTGQNLADRLYPLVLDPAAREAVGMRAHEYIHRHQSAADVASQYREIIERVYAERRAAPNTPRPRGIALLARSERVRVESEARSLGLADTDALRLWWSELRLPRGFAGGKLLIVGGDEQTARLAEIGFGWPRVRRVEPHAVASANDVFDTALVLAAPDERGVLVELLRQLHPRLRDGAPVMLSFAFPATPFDGGAGRRASRLAEALRSAGFQQLDGEEAMPIASLQTGPVLQLGHEWCLLACQRPRLRGGSDDPIGRVGSWGNQSPPLPVAAA